MKIKQNFLFDRAQAGVGMIEVLVAIIILSIGLLGLAGLQTAGLVHNQSATFRSTASIMAYNILDSMRANRIVAGEGGYGQPSPTDPSAGSNNVTFSEQDVKNWQEELALRLPEGTGVVDVDADNKVTITIQWDDSRGALAAQQFVMTTRL